MGPWAKERAAFLPGALIAAALLGCSDREYVYPFFEFQVDTDFDTETDTLGDSEGDTESETESETDTDPCPDDYVDGEGRCIRYVDWDAEATVCGTDWDGAFTKIQDGIDAAYEAAQVLGSCEVWVAAGSYHSYEGDPIDSIHLRKDVQVYGGFAGVETALEQRDISANETVLDGRDGGGSSQVSYHVVMGADKGAIDGFTITGGDARGDSPHHRGGGLYSNSSHTTIRNCTFRGNRAIEGGAAFLYDSAPIVANCRFEQNAAEYGGAVFILNGEAELTDVIIENNTATSHGGGIYFQAVFGVCEPILTSVSIRDNETILDGGGAYIESCAPSIIGSKIANNTAWRDGGGLFGDFGFAHLEGSIVRENTAHRDGGGARSLGSELGFVDAEIVSNSAGGDGGGLYLSSWSESSIATTLVSANTAGADGGGVFVTEDSPLFVDSLVTGNRASRGGGAFNGMRAVATYLNSVFHGNAVSDRGDGIYDAAFSEVDVVNTITFGNGAIEIFDEEQSKTEVRYSDVRGGYPGAFNIDADPLFKAPGTWDDAETPGEIADDIWSNGDYHLEEGSPCVDNADETSSPPADADGEDWEDIENAGLPDTAADIGAYDCES